MIYNLPVGRHQLTINLNRRCGRPPKPLLFRFKEFISHLIKLARNQRYSGHRLSRVLRCLFENKKVKKIFGLNLAAVVLFTGVMGSPISAFNSSPEVEITSVSPAIVQLTTAQSVRVPLDSFEITQGYHFFHPAVDFNGEPGEPVYPIMDGTVKNISYDRFSYGNHVVINHGSGFESLYAHLSKIVVEKEEEVNKNTVIGTVGSTGRATGSHLHLETHDNGRSFNPLTILK